MTYVENYDGTIAVENTLQLLWGANSAGTLCCIQNNGVGELWVIITPNNPLNRPIRHRLLSESFIDETRMDVTAKVEITGNVPDMPFTAWRGND